jgi:hypothetical protein
MVANKNAAIRMSLEGRLLAGPEKIKMNDLQGALSISKILLGLIQVGCLANFHIRADIISGHVQASHVDHLLNRSQRHIS